MVRLPLTPVDIERGERLGALLRAARGDRSMLDVALEARVSPETLRKIETGRVATPAFSTIGSPRCAGRTRQRPSRRRWFAVCVPSGRSARADGYEIRTATVAADKPLFTTIAQLGVAVASFEVIREAFTVKSLQEYAADRAAKLAAV